MNCKNLGILHEVVPFHGMQLFEVLQHGDSSILIFLADDLPQREQDLPKAELVLARFRPITCFDPITERTFSL